MAQRWIRLIMAALALLAGGSAYAQGVNDDPNQPRFGGSGGMSGIGFYRTDTWGLVRSTVENPTDAAIEPLATVSFNPTPYVQYTWRVWTPAKSRRSVWVPLRAGEVDPLAKGVEITALLLDTDRSPEFQLDREAGTLRIEHNVSNTGVLGDSEDDPSIDTAVAMRKSAVRSVRMSYLRQGDLPAVAAAWDGLQSLVICHDAPDLDAGQLDALRAWVIGGGHVWIMADQVSPAFCAALLGEDWTVREVDRVALTDVTILSADGRSDAEPRQFERPVDLARVTAPGMEVLHTVNGWPAALRRKVGLGELLVTTLGPRGWIDDKKGPLPPLEELAGRFHTEAPPPPLPAREMQQFVKQQIGKSIIGRGPIIAVLGTFGVFLLGTGLFLSRRDRLEHLGWIGGGAAVVLALGLMAAGKMKIRELPVTIASTQFAQVIPEQRRAVVTGALSVYSPGQGYGPLKAAKGGVVWPDMAEQEGETLRMEWTDFDQWSWLNLKLPEGAIRGSVFQHAVELVPPAEVLVRFDERGAVGTIVPGPFRDMSDLLLATPLANLSPRMVSETEFIAGSAEVLPAGQFISSGMLSDVQTRRASVYQMLLRRADPTDLSAPTARRRATFPNRPTLLAWAKSMDLGFTLPQAAAHRDAALAAIPLTFVPTPAGTRVSVPSAFVGVRAVRVPCGPMSTVFNNQTGEWMGAITQGATFVIRFELPESVRPLRIESAKVTAHIEAITRSFEVLAIRDESLEPVTRIESPSGTVTIDLPGDRFVTEEGGSAIRVAFRVSESDNADNQWTLRGIGLDVTGTVEATVAGPE